MPRQIDADIRAVLVIGFDDFHPEAVARAEFRRGFTRGGNRSRAGIVTIHARHVGHDTDANGIRRLRARKGERQGAGGGRSG